MHGTHKAWSDILETNAAVNKLKAILIDTIVIETCVFDLTFAFFWIRYLAISKWRLLIATHNAESPY